MANNIGIHPIPKGWRSRDDYTYNPDFKYQSMIVEQNAKKRISKKENIETLIADIKLCNFIEIWNKRGERKNCLCGGLLQYSDAVVVKYHQKGKMIQAVVSGKECPDCERKFVIKELILKAISEQQ